MPRSNIGESLITTTSAAEHRLVGADEVVEVGAADLLLALEQHLDVHRQASLLRQVRLDRLHVHEDLALVVDGAAGVELAVAHRGLERRRGPQLQRIHRLHVVVAVEEDRRRAFGAEPLGVDHRMPGRLHELRVVQADPGELGGRPLGAAADVGGVRRQRRDAGNRQVFLQLLDVAVAVDVDVVDDLVHGSRPTEDRQPGHCHHRPGRRVSAGASRRRRARRRRRLPA